jgi:hypothetical protein
LAVALALPLLRLAWAADPLPKFHLMKGMGPLGAKSFGEGLELLGRTLGRIPWAVFRGLDFGIPLLALPGFLVLKRRNPTLSRELALSLLLALCAQVFFQVKPRFFVDQAPLWIVLSVSLLLAKGRFPTLLLSLSLIVSGLRVSHDLWSPPRTDKRPELQLGRLLRGEGIGPGQLLTDMPRVAWAAGLKPPPPMIWTQAKLKAVLRARHPRYLVFGARRPGRSELAQFAQSMGVPYRRRGLPVSIRDRVGAERILWLERRE